MFESSELREVTTTCMDILSSEIAASYGHLPEDKIYEWATYQSALSTRYMKTEKGTSSTPEGHYSKRRMLERLKKAFETRGNAVDWERYQELFDAHLEDPGTLENFRYFCVPDSDEMIMFYKSIWTGDMASAMEYLHRWGKDLKGNYRKSPENESWYRMTEYEGIAVNERIKAQAIGDLRSQNIITNVCFFGGGNLPERLYRHCLANCNVAVFETGKVADLSELAYTDELVGSGGDLRPADPLINPEKVTIYQENLFKSSTHEELLGEQHLVVMHGVSMYLGRDLSGMVKALGNGMALLMTGGAMSFDYLLMTDGMRRTATAQHWPNAKDMKIFESVDDAIEEARKVVQLANGEASEHYFNIEDTIVNSVEPWGATSVRFVLRKCST